MTRARIEEPSFSTDRRVRRIAAVIAVLAVAGLGVAPAAVAGGPTTFSNTAAITIPQVGQATPYPSTVTVSGMTGEVSKVTVTLNGLTHSVSNDLDILLVAPDGSNLIVMSDIGASDIAATATDLDLTFDDAASTVLGAPMATGTYKPTNVSAGITDGFPDPAPAPSSHTTFADAFGGLSSANGDWSLYVLDDMSGDQGSIAGGWSLTITTLEPTTTTITSSLNPSDPGTSVTFTATVTSSGSPVTAGAVQFTQGSTALGGPVTLATDGTATFTTTVLGSGEHTITASYLGTASLAASEDDLEQVVLPVLTADAGGPYTVAEGGTLTLDASANIETAEFAWDLNGDNDFSDATGASPSLTWDQLVALGIDDGPASHTIQVMAGHGAQDTVIKDADLSVTETLPTASVTGHESATAGEALTIKVSAHDPSPVDMAGLFTYVINWGDGTPDAVVVGPADPPATHTYASPGTYTATVTAASGEGPAGPAFEFAVVVLAAADDGDDLPDTGVESLPALAASAMLVLCGTALLLMTRTQRPNRR